jgi:ATP-binding cassette subfamily B protein
VSEHTPRPAGDTHEARVLWPLWRSAARLAPGNVLVLALLVLVGGASQVLVLLPSAHIIQIIDEQAGHAALGPRRLLPSLALMCLLIATASVARALLHAYGWRLGRKFNGSTRAQVMRAVSGSAELTELEDPAARDRLNTAIGVGPNRYNPGGALLRTTNRAAFAVQTVTAVVLLAVVNIWIGLIVAVTIVFCRRFFARSIAVYALELIAHAGEFRRVEYLRGLVWRPSVARELRIFDMWDWLRGQVVSAWLGVWGRHQEKRRSARGTVLVSVAVFTVGFGAAFLLAFAGWSDGSLSAQSGAVAFQVMIFLAIGLSRSVVDADQSVELGARAVPAAEELIRSAADGARGAGGVRLPQSEPVGIRCTGLTFGYPWGERAEPILEDVSLDIEPGQRVAVVGHNGAGKSTLLKLICGFYPVERGMLGLGGVDVADLDRLDWQRGIAAVQQDFVRYPRSLSFNVATRRTADEDLVRECLADVGLEGLADSLPDGLDTVLLMGHSLSGGQWQRLAIARALYKVRTGARLLVLDEPTANLDPSAELAVANVIGRRAEHITTLTITHRLSLVRGADRILVMEGGRIMESGSHEQLLETGGLYAAMFRTQAAGWVRT